MAVPIIHVCTRGGWALGDGPWMAWLLTALGMKNNS
jgi:hypothetical protein